MGKLTNLDKILDSHARYWSNTGRKQLKSEEAKQQIKDLFLALADELTDDMSGLGRDIINADELKQRIKEL